jgi:hypothetical protein
VRRCRHLDADALIERAPQHVGQRLDQLADIDLGRAELLAPREREQLAGQLGAAPTGPRGGGDHLLRAGVGCERGMVLQHLQVALDHGQQVVEVVRDAAGQLADAFHALRMVQRLFALRALQACRQQVRQRFEEVQLVGAEALGLARAHRQHADDLAAVDQRHREGADQPLLQVIGRHREALLGAVVGHRHRPSLRQHEAGRCVGAVRPAAAEAFDVEQADATGHVEFQPAGFQQEDDRRIDLQRVGRDRRHLLQQQLRVARVDCQPTHLRDELAVASALQRLPHPRVGLDAAHGRDDERLPFDLQRAERDLDHHLAAVAALRDQFHLHAHRARFRLVAVGLAVGRMARADRVRHQRLHRQAGEFAGTVAEQPLCFRVGHHDAAAAVDQQQRVRVGTEQRAIDRIRRWSRCRHQRRAVFRAWTAGLHRGVTTGTST